MNGQERILQSPEVRELIRLAFKEDRVENDITALATNLGDRPARAKIIAKAHTVAAGAALLPLILNAAAEDASTRELKGTALVADGTALEKNDVFMKLEGRAYDILRVERTLLNFLIRMCGIATETKRVVDLLQDTSCKVLHTRKTAPGHRHTDIYAALCGGAHAHRVDLADAILVKENHLRSATSFQVLFDGIERLRKQAKFVEVEVTNMIELKHALMARPDRILLDNFTVADIEKAVMIFGSAVQLEASGGINLGNAKAYADTGVDYISMGWITHSAPAADLSLLFEV